MTTGWPDEYYAVIFTNQREDSDLSHYAEVSDRMIELAQRQPGFLGLESVRDDSGLGITVSYWRDYASIKAWGAHAEHRLAQDLGRKKFYRWFQLRIAKVTHEHGMGLENL